MTERSNVVVPLLSMHRSGTSLTMSLLASLGLKLGEPLMPPSPHNPRGYWENMFFYQTNISLLQKIGSHDHGYGRPDQLFNTFDRLKNLENRSKQNDIKKYIDQHFQDNAWGFKDPRTVLTWGFWRRNLCELGFQNFRPVVVVRHPQACVQSLIKRSDHFIHRLARAENQTSFEYSLAMWRAYYQLILNAMKLEENPVTYICQEDLLGPLAPTEVARLAHAVGLKTTKLEETLSKIEPALDHRKPTTSLDDLTLSIYQDLLSRVTVQREEFMKKAPATSKE